LPAPWTLLPRAAVSPFTQLHPWSLSKLRTDFKPSNALQSAVFFNTGLIMTAHLKQSHYRPGQALRVPGGWGSQISRHLAHEGGKVVSPMHRPPLLPRKYSWYSFLLRAESTPGAMVWPEGLCQWKIPVTPLGMEPATFRLVAQCLNQLRYQQRVP